MKDLLIDQSLILDISPTDQKLTEDKARRSGGTPIHNGR
jgi:hypothetical protein